MELRAASARDDVAELIAGRPEPLRVVLATRHDPQLGLHRLRLTGQLAEICEADLRFNLAETHKLLEAARVRLDDDSLSQLHGRTEGWAAGLRLAALSLAGHPDPRRAASSPSSRAMSGPWPSTCSPRCSPASPRTSVACSFGPPSWTLCPGRWQTTFSAFYRGSKRILLSLEDENTLVVSVDAARTTFRYHQLLVDLLRLELRRRSPEDVAQLHLAAAEWYVAHGNAL